MKFLKRLFDSLQVWLYLGGNSTLANFIGRWGTAPAEFQPIELLPKSTPVAKEQRWTTEDHDPAEPLKAIDFDPLWNDNDQIDVARDINWATSKHEIN